MEGRRAIRPDAIAIAAILAALTAWFGNVLSGANVFYLKDLFRYHLPMKHIVREAMFEWMRSGELPLWNPFYGSGQPLAANPAFELFYPPQWLVLLPGFTLGFNLHILVHAYIAAIGMYCLLRSLAVRPVASTAGALSFGIGGLLLSLFRLLPFLFAVSWLPLIALFARRFLLTRSRRDFALAALFLGMQALVAEPTTLLQTWALLGAYAVYRVLRDTTKERARRFGRQALLLVLLVAAGLVAGAAQIVPAIDFAPDSVRSRPLDFADVISFWSMAPVRPLELFFGSFFSSTYDNNGVSRAKALSNGAEPFFPSIYAGLPMAVLALAGLLARRRGWGLVLAIGAVSYVVAIGANTPLLRFLYEAGIFRSIRYPAKFAIAGVFALIVWGAMSLDRLLDGDREIAKWAMRVLSGWAVLALLLMAFSYNLRAEGAFWIGILLRGGAVAAVLWAIHRRPSPIWGGVLVVVTLLDLAPLRSRLNPTMPARYFDAPPAAATLPANRAGYRIFHTAEWDWHAIDPRGEAWFGSEHGPWWFIRNAMMPRTPAAWDFRTALDQDYDETFLLPTADLVEAMRNVREAKKEGWERPFLAMSGSWFTTRFRDFAADEKRFGGDAERMTPVDFVPAPERYPRYYFADQVEQAGSVAMFTQKLLASSWSPRVAFLDASPFPPAWGRVLRSKETMRTIALDVESAGRALLVVSVTPYKYWRATIDGRPATLQAANLGYQAVEVPRGKHTVRLVYSNPLVAVAALVSLLALLAIAVVVAITPRTALPPEAAEVLRVAEAPPAPKPAKKRRR
jgi:hypothetical protein